MLLNIETFRKKCTLYVARRNAGVWRVGVVDESVCKAGDWSLCPITYN